MLVKILLSLLGLLITIAVARYLYDAIKEDKNTKSRISEYGETYKNYFDDWIAVFIGFSTILIIIFIILVLPIIKANNLKTSNFILIFSLLYALYFAIRLPLSKIAFNNWLKDAKKREIERKELEEKRKSEREEKEKQEKEKKELELKQKELREYFTDLINWLELNGKETFIKNIYKKEGLNNISKLVQTGINECLVIDDKEKKFVHLKIIDIAQTGYMIIANVKVDMRITDFVYVRINAEEFSLIDYKKTDLQPLLNTFYNLSDASEVYSYEDLIRYKIIDKTETRIQVAEKVVTTKYVAFDVVLYFNKLENNTYSIHVTSEEELRELVGTLEYILHNNKNNNPDLENDKKYEDEADSDYDEFKEHACRGFECLTIEKSLDKATVEYYEAYKIDNELFETYINRLVSDDNLPQELKNILLVILNIFKDLKESDNSIEDVLKIMNQQQNESKIDFSKINYDPKLGRKLDL